MRALAKAWAPTTSVSSEGNLISWTVEEGMLSSCPTESMMALALTETAVQPLALTSVEDISAYYEAREKL